MRIWDISPGYLNRQSLLGEHRELHGIVSILLHNKKGYSKHPETLRWIKYPWALKIRHELLAAEMRLRGFNEQSPVTINKDQDRWPTEYINSPSEQFGILKKKYEDKEKGRIPLPQTAQQLWSHHKYSILARDVKLYKKIGKTVAIMSPKDDFSSLSCLLTERLRYHPTIGGIQNAVQHMWGYVAKYYVGGREDIVRWSVQHLLQETQQLAVEMQEPYILNSTALSELQVYLAHSIV